MIEALESISPYFSGIEIKDTYECSELCATHYIKNEFWIAIVHDHCDKDGVLVSVELREHFNKEGQMPICFVISDKGLGRRAAARIHAAMQFCLDNRPKSFIGELPGFDDLGQWVRDTYFR